MEDEEFKPKVSDVRVGQFWFDNDKRAEYPAIKIMDFEPMGHKDCSGTSTWALVHRGCSRDAVDGAIGYTVVKSKIRLDRLVKGGCRGYTMIHDVVEISGSVGHYADCTLETPERCSCDNRK